LFYHFLFFPLSFGTRRKKTEKGKWEWSEDEERGEVTR
jgi:hypothetical protein